ncbi:MAG: DUF86 domain-containing protein [Methanoregula sp.]|uniref:HepT-like ribonuclease domain-containing protein n=1 Tax=Methanoregula sp. TaxID=2052170 RepID=UPI003C68D2A6
MLESSDKIEKYLHGISFDEFTSDEMRKDAVIRNFEIIGEAIKNLPAELKEQYPKTDWKKIAGFRDVLTHAYFGIKPTILWDNAKNNLPLLKKEIRHILKSEESRK